MSVENGIETLIDDENTKNGVYNMVCILQRFIEVLSEWHIQVFQLRG